MAELARFLPAFLAADLLLPFALAPFYPGYRHKEQVMSALGSKKSPVRAVYSGWLVLLGLFLLACNPGLYRALTPGPAWVFLALLDLYAVGACLLAGLFPVGDGKGDGGLSARVHGATSAIGFIALAFAPLAEAVWAFQSQGVGWGLAFLAGFFLALGAFSLFVMADKPVFANTPLAWEGLWQRVALLLMYLPLAALCVLF